MQGIYKHEKGKKEKRDNGERLIWKLIKGIRTLSAYKEDKGEETTWHLNMARYQYQHKDIQRDEQGRNREDIK